MKVLVSDSRQDLVLQEFVDQGKWKNALEHCEKRMKKLKKGTDHRLDLNYFLIELKSSLASRSISSDLLSEIISSHPVFIEYLDSCDDLEFVEHIEENFCHTGGELWKKVAKNRKRDEDFYQRWFDLKYQAYEFRDAAEACMYWRLHHPSKGAELTMKMAMCYDLSSRNFTTADRGLPKDPEQQEKDAKMAVHLLRQAAKTASADNGKDSPLRTTADLELLVHVFQRNGLLQEAIDILNDTKVGLQSSLGSWDLARQKINLLERIKDYSQLLVFCKEILLDVLDEDAGEKQGRHWKFGEAGDDMLVFNGAITAASRLNDVTNFSELKKLYQKLADIGSYNARLALVKLKMTSGSPEDCLEQAKKFYTLYSNKSQVVSVLAYLPPTQRNAFIAFVARQNLDSRHSGPDDKANLLKDLQQRINCLKIKYDLLYGLENAVTSSLSEHQSIDLRHLIQQCIWTYMTALAAEPKKAAGDNSIADPALIVAARGLIRLSSKDSSALHLARLLLESLVSNSRYNYEALILLVRVCKSQSAITQVIAYYKRLEIKNLQQINESGLLFPEISLILPQSTTAGVVTASHLLESAIAWSSKRRSTIESQSITCIDNGDWTGACRAVEFASEWNLLPGVVLASSELVRIKSRLGTAIDCPSFGIFANVVKHCFGDGSTLDASRLPSYIGVPLSHGRESLFLDGQVIGDTSGMFLSTLTLVALHVVVREIPTELTLAQLNAILNLEPSGVHPFSAAVKLVRDTLSSAPTARLKPDVLSTLENDIELGLQLIERLSGLAGHDHTEQGLAEIPGARCVMLQHEILDSLGLLYETVEWLRRRHPQNQLEEVARKVLEKIIKMRLSVVQWSKDRASLINGKAATYAQEIEKGFLGPELSALLGTQVKDSMEDHLASVQLTLRGLEDGR